MSVLTVLLILFACVAIAVHVAGLALTAASARATRRPVPPPSPALATPVTLLRPACGIENNVAATLESSFRLDYPDYEVIFCVAEESDPVIPVIET